MKIKNKKTGIRTILTITLLFALLILIIEDVRAEDYVRLNASDSQMIDKHDVCRTAENEVTGPDTFIPLKTSTEWTEFIIHHPNHIELLDDCSRYLDPHVLDCFWAANKTICETNMFWADGKSNQHEDEHLSAWRIGGCDDGHDVTVLDTYTGICYMRNWNILGISTLAWAPAMDYCENLALCDDGTWDGNETTEGTCSGSSIEKNDWVLPTKREILRAVDYERTTAPMIIGGNNNIFQSVQSAAYWSSSRRDAGHAWTVNLLSGLVSFRGVAFFDGVVCVSRS